MPIDYLIVQSHAGMIMMRLYIVMICIIMYIKVYLKTRNFDEWKL